MGDRDCVFTSNPRPPSEPHRYVARAAVKTTHRANSRYVSIGVTVSVNDVNADLVTDPSIPISLLLKEFYAERSHDLHELVSLVAKYSVMVPILEKEDDALAAAGPEANRFSHREA
jgi:hypothetical protein